MLVVTKSVSGPSDKAPLTKNNENHVAFYYVSFHGASVSRPLVASKKNHKQASNQQRISDFQKRRKKTSLYFPNQASELCRRG